MYHSNPKQTGGRLLPGQTSTISFSFKSADPGVFSDRWWLETVPLASFSFSLPPPTTARGGSIPHRLSDDGSDYQGPSAANSRSCDGQSRQETGERVAVFDGSNKKSKGVVSRNGNQEDTKGGHVSNKGQLLGSASENGVLLELRGVALSPDTREHARKKLSEGVERGIMAAKVEEIVREVVRGVRTPIREEEVTLIFRRFCNVMLNRGFSSLESPWGAMSNQTWFLAGSVLLQVVMAEATPLKVRSKGSSCSILLKCTKHFLISGYGGIH